MANPREYTCRLLEMVDEGSIGMSEVLNAALSYMSEDDVKDMIRVNDWLDMLESEESPDDEEEAEINGCEGCAAIANGLRDKKICLGLSAYTMAG